MTVQGEGGHYYLLRMINEGGMGKVFLAEPAPAHDPVEQESPTSASTAPTITSANSCVAVKFFKTSVAGSDAMALLRRELSALRALRHDRIPAAIDWRLQSPNPFVVFPFFAKGSLHELVRREGPLPIQDAWNLLEDLLDALAAAHRACLLHLDVKPGNVLISNDRRFHLGDFGIATGMHVSRHMVQPGIGTPVFQAPEQKEYWASTFDVRTDLWGAGITVYAALTRKNASELNALMGERTDEPTALPPPSTLGVACPAIFEEILLSLLRWDKDLRPGSVAQVLTHVRSVRHGAVNVGPGHDTPEAADLRSVIGGLIDPVWRSILTSEGDQLPLVSFPAGAVLCREGDESFTVFVLLRGTVDIFKADVQITSVSGEGVFVGEVSTLTGIRRTASLVASTPVTAIMFSQAQLEEFVGRYPAIIFRLAKTLALRLQDEASARIALTRRVRELEAEHSPAPPQNPSLL